MDGVWVDVGRVRRWLVDGTQVGRQVMKEENIVWFQVQEGEAGETKERIIKRNMNSYRCFFFGKREKKRKEEKKRNEKEGRGGRKRKV